MADYIGEIRMFGYSFTTVGWKACDGSLLPISEYEALFTLIGTTYGGDGENTFALPDLRSRIPIHQGTGPGLSPYIIGQQAGVETVTLTNSQLPNHYHRLLASTIEATTNAPGGSVYPAATNGTLLYSTTAASSTQLSPSAILPAGGNQPIDNMMPYLTINFQICYTGIYPPQF